VERTLLSVEPADEGWRVRLRGLVLDEKPTQFAAIDSASEHAFNRYVVTGRPTGVSLVLGGGESVLVSLNG
jgi:hypothetical protein